MRFQPQEARRLPRVTARKSPPKSTAPRRDWGGARLFRAPQFHVPGRNRLRRHTKRDSSETVFFSEGGARGGGVTVNLERRPATEIIKTPITTHSAHTPAWRRGATGRCVCRWPPVRVRCLSARRVAHAKPLQSQRRLIVGTRIQGHSAPAAADCGETATKPSLGNVFILTERLGLDSQLTPLAPSTQGAGKAGELGGDGPSPGRAMPRGLRLPAEKTGRGRRERPPHAASAQGRPHRAASGFQALAKVPSHGAWWPGHFAA